MVGEKGGVIMSSAMLADIGRLTELQEEFRENGFLILPEVLSVEENDRYLEVMDRLDRTVTVGARNKARRPGEGLELRSCIKKAPEFMDLVDRPDILELLGVLLGYNIQLGNSHAFIRPGFEKHADVTAQGLFGWHRDLGRTMSPVNGRYPHLATRVGYFFTDADQPDMGSLFLVPGSHRSAGRPAWDRRTDQPFGLFELLVEARTAVIFDNRLWHATSPNFAAGARKNLYMEYAQRWLRPFDYYFQDPETYLSSDPVRRQLLGYDFHNIEDGWVGYQEPDTDEDTPLRAWLTERGLTDIPQVAED
jgi:ectoine hydroxylase